MTSIICGGDVASGHLDARLRPETDVSWRRLANTAKGVGELAAFCRAHVVGLVVMEAAGVSLPLGLLWAAGVPAAIVNPRTVRRFAEAMGLLEKTDRIDAGVIAWGSLPSGGPEADREAEVKRLAAQPPAGETQERLAALVTRLRQPAHRAAHRASEPASPGRRSRRACLDRRGDRPGCRPDPRP